MKKVLLIAAVASLGIVSCKKDYSCTCKDGTDSYTFTAKSGKKDAKSWCDATQKEINEQSGGSGVTCTLD